MLTIRGLDSHSIDGVILGCGISVRRSGASGVALSSKCVSSVHGDDSSVRRSLDDQVS